MNSAFSDWISEHAKGDVRGYCRQIAQEMADAFPALTVWGKFCPIDGTGHAWCQTPDGQIVDPTASQFAEGYNYAGGVPLSDFPTGKCMECGELIYGKTGYSGLHAECEAAYAAYVTRGCR